MEIIIWILGAFFVAFVFGTARVIGFWPCLLVSLLLSPIIGLIITLFSETKKVAEDRKRMMELQRQQNELLAQRNAKP